MLQFLTILATVFIAEMGDKTQLMLVAMCSRYKVHDIVIGTALAIAVLNALAVGAGAIVGSLVPPFVIKLIAAVAFAFFALSSLSTSDKEEETRHSKLNIAILAVFATFFIAELGDKTQLTAITFGASSVTGKGVIAQIASALPTWLACSIGLFLADMVGLVVGLLLKTKIDDSLLKKLAFVIFSLFFILSLYQGLKAIGDFPLTPILITVAILYILASTFIIIHSLKKTKH